MTFRVMQELVREQRQDSILCLLALQSCIDFRVSRQVGPGGKRLKQHQRALVPVLVWFNLQGHALLRKRDEVDDRERRTGLRLGVQGVGFGGVGMQGLGFRV